MKLKIVIVMMILISLVFCSKKNSTKLEAVAPEDLLPKDNELNGQTWTEEFWTAKSGSELSSYINGTAALYVDQARLSLNCVNQRSKAIQREIPPRARKECFIALFVEMNGKQRAWVVHFVVIPKAILYVIYIQKGKMDIESMFVRNAKAI